jgi:PIN domain nuclease of toxin-antitoxin system
VTDRLLLDTCALIWLANGEPLYEPGRTAMASAEVYVSPFSA